MIDVRQQRGKWIITTGVVPVSRGHSGSLDPIEALRDGYRFCWNASGDAWRPMGPAMEFDTEEAARQYIETRQQELIAAM